MRNSSAWKWVAIAFSLLQLVPVMITYFANVPTVEL